MSSLQELSPHAELVSKSQALQVNVAAAMGLQSVLATNLGPTGTLKLLVGGTVSQLKLTKDGLTLLREMQIQHPTAALIARTATAQDDVTGDGTTSTVLLVGELLKQAAHVVSDNRMHPRIVTDGFDVARDACLEFLNSFQIPVPDPVSNRDLLLSMARTSLSTKLDAVLARKMATAVVEAVTTIYDPDRPIDLHRVEILARTRQSALDSRFVKGLVLDHGSRHPDMPKLLRNVHILICNVSLEYEPAETQAAFVYKSAAERETLVESERVWLDERCRKIIDFKRRVCGSGSGETETSSFCIINQKGVDPLSLDMFAKEGILCLRRAKRRNMERLALATGGQPILSLEDLDATLLGYAGQVSEETYGEDKYTFVEDCPNAHACTLLLQGPNELTTYQIQDAVKDGLRSIKNTIEDGAVVPGAGAFELAASLHLRDTVVPKTKGKMKLGVQAFAEALLIIPKTLIANAGYDVPEAIIELEEERQSSQLAVGFNCFTGKPMLPENEGVYDNVRVKRQSLHLCTVLANQLLLVDEVMKAGKQMGKSTSNGPAPDDMM